MSAPHAKLTVDHRLNVRLEQPPRRAAESGPRNLTETPHHDGTAVRRTRPQVLPAGRSPGLLAVLRDPAGAAGGPPLGGRRLALEPDLSTGSGGGRPRPLGGSL